MIGNNSISLNAATVIEALQEYFDKRAQGPIAEFIVKSVRHHASSDHGFIEAKIEGRED